MEDEASRGASTAWLDERYRQIIEQVEDYAVFTLDNEGLVRTWNEGAKRILGFSEAEALAQPSSFIFTPEDRERGIPRQELERARYQGKADDERWHLRKDGRRFYASGVLTALRDDRGRPDGFSKILRDLTRWRDLEEERRRELRAANEALEQRVAERTRELEARNEALRQSEQRFAQAFRAGPVAACMTTLGEERLLEVNEAFLELTGLSRDEVIGRSHKALQLWSSPEGQAKLQRLGEASFRNEEFTLRTKQGGLRTVVLSREIIVLDGERSQLKQFYDVTERKRNEEQLRSALEQVMSDAGWFAQKVLEELAQVRVGEPPRPQLDLSKREREVLERLAKGVTNAAIAEELGIAPQTVRNYISEIYSKLGVHSRGEAIVWARERGIV